MTEGADNTGRIADCKRTLNLPLAMLAGCALLLASLLLLRWWGGIAGRGMMWDEGQMYPIVENISQSDWSWDSLVNYQDTKGPAFFWLYAAFEPLLGGGLSSLRWLSILLTTLCALPLALLCRHAGMRLGDSLLITAFFLVLPYNLVLSELFMSEPSFLLGALLLATSVTWALDHPSDRVRHVIGPVLYAVLLAVLLHHRAHAVAMAGAVCLLALFRSFREARPWWIATVIAGLLRVPLFLLWGGLVGAKYQARYGLGFRLDSLVYLAIAALPCTLIFTFPMIQRLWIAPEPGPGTRNIRSVLVWAAIVGATAGAFALPDLPLYFGAAAAGGDGNFQGPLATALRPIQDWSGPLYLVTTCLLAAVGFVSIAAMMVAAFDHGPTATPCIGRLRTNGNLLVRFAAVTLGAGWLLSALSKGDIFDRYLLAYLALMPFVWVMRLSRRFCALQFCTLLVLALLLAREWYWVRPLP